MYRRGVTETHHLIQRGTYGSNLDYLLSSTRLYKGLQIIAVTRVINPAKARQQSVGSTMPMHYVQRTRPSSAVYSTQHPQDQMINVRITGKWLPVQQAKFPQDNRVVMRSVIRGYSQQYSTVLGLCHIGAQPYDKVKRNQKDEIVFRFYILARREETSSSRR